MKTKFFNTLIFPLALLPMSFGQINAQSEDSEDGRKLDEIVVTGSYISGTAEDAALPVDVVSAEDIRLQGSPQLIDLIRNLGVSSGTDGQNNNYTSRGLQGTSNVNLRGLGAGRTLVLLNGRRQTFSPIAIGEQAQLFVDINMIPTAAIRRIEVLKDGAAALYGSDAIAGVVNFITNNNFEGFSVSFDSEFIDGSDGNYNLAVAYGVQFERGSWVTSIGQNTRNELATSERGWSSLSFEENRTGGWSSIGNPGSFLARGNFDAGTGPNSVRKTPLRFALADPNCGNFGGVADPIADANGTVRQRVRCRFQYTQFANIVENERRAQIFSEFNYGFSEFDLHIETLIGFADVPTWHTSPSYPPNHLYEQIVLPNHPGLLEFRRQNPEWANIVYTKYNDDGSVAGTLDPNNAETSSLIFYGRPFGYGGNPVTGGAEEGSRDRRTIRLATSLSGETENEIGWEIGIGFSEAKAKNLTKDTKIYAFERALKGFGGPNCTGSVAGQNGCEYFNPFSNAIPRNAATGKANPQYRAQLANSKELTNWMRDYGLSRTATTRLITLDGAFHGESDWSLDGGNAGWAVGFQFRHEEYDVDPVDSSDNTKNPCAKPNSTIDSNGRCVAPDGSISQPNGLFAYLAGINPYSKNQNIFAGFAEWQLPFTDQIDVQVALRYEKYPGDVGQTIDPKIAFKFQANDRLAIRGSAQTSFKGPTLNQLNPGRETTLQYISVTGAFKAVDQKGRLDLDPETSVSFNVGGIFSAKGLTASVDYYNFNFSDTIIVESHDRIVSEAIKALNRNDNSAKILNRITFQNQGTPTASEIARIVTNIINGPSVQTSGLDIRVEYDFDTEYSEVTVGAEATIILEYDVGEYQIEDIKISGFDGLGYLNRNNFARSLPEMKFHVWGNFRNEIHNVRIDARFTSEYDDQRYNPLNTSNFNRIKTIDSFTQWDVSYSMDLKEKYGFNVFVSGWNIFDAAPPSAPLDFGYDPYTHPSYGRTFKIGTQIQF